MAGAPEVPLGAVPVEERFERRAGGVPTLPHIHVLIIGMGSSLVQELPGVEPIRLRH